MKASKDQGIDQQKVTHSKRPTGGEYDVKLGNRVVAIACKTVGGFTCDHKGLEITTQTMRDLKMRVACQEFDGYCYIVTGRKLYRAIKQDMTISGGFSICTK